jgi:hypothetical protein
MGLESSVCNPHWRGGTAAQDVRLYLVFVFLVVIVFAFAGRLLDFHRERKRVVREARFHPKG